MYVNYFKNECKSKLELKSNLLIQFVVLLIYLSIPRRGDREVTFAVVKSSCHLLLPV